MKPIAPVRNDLPNMDTQEARNPLPPYRQSSLPEPDYAADAHARSRWLMVVAAMCGAFVSFGSLMVFTFGIFMSALTRQFAWSRGDVSLAFTVTALTVAVCSPVLGRLLDRYGARRIILPCMAIFGLAFGSLSLLTGHIWHLYAVFVVLGIVGNGTTQLGYSRVITAWFDEKRGFALALVMAGVGAGAIVFPSLAEWLITTVGWRTAYALLGGLILLFGIPLTAAFVREPVRRTVAGQSQARIVQAGSSVAEGIRTYAFLGIVVAIVLIAFVTNGVIGHLAPLIMDRGFSGQQAALAASLLGAATLASRLGTGYLLDLFFAPRVAAVLFFLSAFGIWLVTASNQLWLSYLGAILIGAGLGAEADVVPYLLSRYFGLRAFSELYGYTWSAYAVAAALGPLVMGKMFDRTHSYETTLFVFVALMAAAGAVFCFMPKYRAEAERVG
jgi:MFS family permease